VLGPTDIYRFELTGAVLTPRSNDDRREAGVRCSNVLGSYMIIRFIYDHFKRDAMTKSPTRAKKPLPRKLTIKRETLRDLTLPKEKAEKVEGATGNRCGTGFTGHG